MHKPVINETVGILTGIQTGSPFVGSTGTVVRVIRPWGSDEYVVLVNGEELVYPAYLLAEIRTADQRRAARLCVDCADIGTWDDGSTCQTCRPAVKTSESQTTYRHADGSQTVSTITYRHTHRNLKGI